MDLYRMSRLLPDQGPIRNGPSASAHHAGAAAIAVSEAPGRIASIAIGISISAGPSTASITSAVAANAAVSVTRAAAMPNDRANATKSGLTSDVPETRLGKSR